MKRAIDKVRIPAAAHDIFMPIPAGADVLSIGFVGADLCVFYMADVGAPQDRIRLLVLPEGTPVDLPDGMDLTLLGRAEKPAGALVLANGKPPATEVFHVFQIVKAPT